MSLNVIFLGLRTNVSYFASRIGFAKLENRVKTLALLYDQVLFEEGVYECHVGPEGALDYHTALVADYQLKPVRTRRGARTSIGMAPEGSDNFSTVMATEVERSFRSQFYGLMRQLGSPAPAWALMGALKPESKDRAEAAAKEWTQRESGLAKEAFPGKAEAERFLRGKVHSNLNLDLAKAAALDCDVAPHGLYEPLMRVKAKAAAGSGTVPAATGMNTLRVLLPQIETATWEDIDDLRKDRCLVALRTKMKEIDKAASGQDDVGKQLVEDLLAQVDKDRPRWYTTGLWSLVQFVGGSLPFPIGTMVGLADLAKSGGSVWRGRRTWTAALVRARQKLDRSKRMRDWAACA